MNRQETAETVALQALSWLLGQPEELGGFLAASGASPAATASRRAGGQGAGRALATTAKSAVLLLQPAPRR